MKKILFLGAGFPQSYAIQRARAMGYYTIAIDRFDRSSGVEYAHQTVKMDLDNLQACLAVAQINQVDGVMNSYLKSGIDTAAYIISEMNLLGIDSIIAQLIRDKYTLRKALWENGIIESDKVYLFNHIEELKGSLDSIYFPVLVKPYGNGVTKIAHNIKELNILFKEAYEESKTHQVIMEEYIEGREFSVEVFVYQGDIQIYGIMEKLKDFNPGYIEIGFKSLAKLPGFQAAYDLIFRVIRVLGIEFGSVNIEIIQTPDMKYHIVNMNPGVGGSVISSHIIPKVLRYDYIDNVIRAVVGDPFQLPVIRYTRNIATRKLALNADQYLDIEDIRQFEKEYHVKLYYENSAIVNKENTLAECVLYIIGAEDSSVHADRNVSKVASLISNERLKAKEAVP